MQAAVFLDRDGTLNKLVIRDGQRVSPRALEEFELLPGVASAVCALRKSGLLVIVVTNQPDIRRGLLASAVLDEMHAQLRQELAVNAIYTCPHDDRDSCPCRKPKPGLLLQAAQEWSISLRSSYVVGDSWKDIQAGEAAECATCLLAAPGTNPAACTPGFVASDLPAAAEVIIRRIGSGETGC